MDIIIQNLNITVQDDTKLDQIISLLTQIGTDIMADLGEITAQVEETGDVQASAVVLLNGLKEMLDAAGTDPAALAALSSQLGDTTDALAAAIVANTPAGG